VIRVTHVSLPTGLSALARRGPGGDLLVYVSQALTPDRQREAVRAALRAARGAGWRGLLPAPSLALLAFGAALLRRAAGALRAHAVAWGTAATVLAASAATVYLTLAPHHHGQPPGADRPGGPGSGLVTGAGHPPGAGRAASHARHTSRSPQPGAGGRSGPAPRPVVSVTVSPRPSTAPSPAPSTSPSPQPSSSASPSPRPKRHCIINLLGIRICLSPLL
jgi:hypothetical protein